MSSDRDPAPTSSILVPGPGPDAFPGSTLMVKRAGLLRLTSGAVGFADPGISGREVPALDVVAGLRPLDLTILTLSDGDERISHATLLFGEGPLRWSPALSDASGPEVTVEVDSGTIAVAGPSFLQDAGDDLALELHSLIESNYVPTRSWAGVGGDQAGGYECIAFTSGFGDGVYPVFAGYDERGQACCLTVACISF